MATDAHLAFNGFEPATKAQLPADAAQIEMGLFQRQVGKVGPQHREIEGRATEDHQQIILRQFFSQAKQAQRLMSDERGIASPSIEAHHRDLPERIGFDIQIQRSLPQPFVETPLVACRQSVREVAAILLFEPCLCLFDPVVEEGFSRGAEPPYFPGRQKVIPRCRRLDPRTVVPVPV